MKAVYLSYLIFVFFFNNSFSQELDTYQNDSIYAKNKISRRTMYFVFGDSSQKETVTEYNPSGKMIRQFWYWNGEKDFHNVETFYYSGNGVIFRATDSTKDGNIKLTTYNYENGILESQVTFDELHDTCDFRVFPQKNITIRRWYRDGKPCRYDTTVFGKENVKLEYYGTENSYTSDWHYKFINEFDSNENLTRVLLKLIPQNFFTRYSYDNRNLLIKKQKVLFAARGKPVESEYVFTYE